MRRFETRVFVTHLLLPSLDGVTRSYMMSDKNLQKANQMRKILEFNCLNFNNLRNIYDYAMYF